MENLTKTSVLCEVCTTATKCCRGAAALSKHLSVCHNTHFHLNVGPGEKLQRLLCSVDSVFRGRRTGERTASSSSSSYVSWIFLRNYRVILHVQTTWERKQTGRLLKTWHSLFLKDYNNTLCKSVFPKSRCLQVYICTLLSQLFKCNLKNFFLLLPSSPSTSLLLGTSLLLLVNANF